MKKLLFTFVVLLLPMIASAEYIDYGFEFTGEFSHWGEPDAEINDIYYQLNPSDQTASVTYKTVCFDDARYWPVSDYSGDIVIPSQVIYEGVTYTVTSIDNYAFNNTHDSFYPYSLINRSSLTSITSVSIPSTVTSIGNRAFENCLELSSITILGNLTSIGRGTFGGCISLISISLPSSVSSIGEYAFAGCSCLTNISIPNNVTSIGEYAFAECNSLTNISIPDNVTSIGEYAFNGCSNLTTVTLGYYLSSIASSFHNCNKLSNVYCYAPVPPTYSEQPFDEEVVYSNSLFLYVPSSSLEDYKYYEWKGETDEDSFGWSSIKPSYILPISSQGSQKLGTPTISITNGVLKFDCGTDGAEYRYSITYPESKSNATGNNIQLTQTCIISVYAIKAGYDRSDTTTKEIKNGDLNGDGNVDVGDHVELTNIIMAQ